MTHKFTATIATSLVLASTQAQADTVMASVKPLTLITSELLANVAQVDTLLPDGASPHDFALRPSDRKRLNNTELLIWVGPEIEPYLAKVIEASKVEHMTMLDEHADHGEEEHHDDHKNHAHEEEHHDAHEVHDHAGLHPWLDIEAVEHFAEELSAELQHHFLIKPLKSKRMKRLL